jgi:hypothetical protein
MSSSAPLYVGEGVRSAPVIADRLVGTGRFFGAFFVAFRTVMFSLS